MPRYVVERTFSAGLNIPTTPDVAVTWVHSYVSQDRSKTFCVYDGPDPESIRRAATSNGLPVDLITQVSVLDPYFYV